MRKFLLASAALLVVPTGAGAVGFKTQFSCASDYYSYCSEHSVGSPGLRKCMRANGPRLSSACINALIEDGEVSRAEVEREKAKLVAAKAKPKPAEPKKVEAAGLKKPQPAARKTDVAGKTAAPTVAKAKTSTPAIAEKKRPAKASIAAAAQPRDVMVAPVARAMPHDAMLLDQPTFEALKTRGTRFVSADVVEIAIPQPAAASPPGGAAPASAIATPVAASVTRQHNDPQLEPHAEPSFEPAGETVIAAPSSEPEPDRAEAEPASRPVPFPESRMSLGRNVAPSETRSWWDDLVSAVTGQ